MSNLKPCPFCGPQTDPCPPYHTTNSIGNFIIECGWCGLPVAEQMPKEADKGERERVWNTRPQEDALQARIDELEALINNPQYDDFDEAVKTECAHQIERWGEDHDLHKGPMDFLAVWVRLHGKYVEAIWSSDFKKAEHHMITAAACLRNHHKALKHALAVTGEG